MQVRLQAALRGGFYKGGYFDAEIEEYESTNLESSPKFGTNKSGGQNSLLFSFGTNKEK